MMPYSLRFFFFFLFVSPSGFWNGGCLLTLTPNIQKFSTCYRIVILVLPEFLGAAKPTRTVRENLEGTQAPSDVAMTKVLPGNS